MKHPLVAGGVLILFLGIAPILEVIDGLRPFDRPRLVGEPCETVTWAEIEPLNLDFEGKTAQTRGRTNGVQIRSPWSEEPVRCRQLWRRADCIAAGPMHVRALSDNASVYYRISEGQTGRIRAHRGRIACVITPDPAS